MSNEKKGKINGGLAIGIVCGLLIVIAIVVIIIVNANSKKANNNVPRDNEGKEEEVVFKEYTEQDLIDAYGMSIKDAEALVLTLFLSDNFECSTKIEGSHYMVTVTDVLSEEKFLYDVNPASSEYFRVK